MDSPAAGRGRARRLALGLLLALHAAWAPITAMAAAATPAVCTTTSFTVTFLDHPITATPDPASNRIEFTAGAACTGTITGTATWTGTGTALPGTSCTGPLVVVDGAASFTSPRVATQVAVVVVGTTAAQAWIFADTTVGSANLFGMGAFVWSATEAQLCPNAGGMAAIHLSGSVAIYY
jgi:hypothetical protein